MKLLSPDIGSADGQQPSASLPKTWQLPRSRVIQCENKRPVFSTHLRTVLRGQPTFGTPPLHGMAEASSETVDGELPVFSILLTGFSPQELFPRAFSGNLLVLISVRVCFS